MTLCLNVFSIIFITVNEFSAVRIGGEVRVLILIGGEVVFWLEALSKDATLSAVCVKSLRETALFLAEQIL